MDNNKWYSKNAIFTRVVKMSTENECFVIFEI